MTRTLVFRGANNEVNLSRMPIGKRLVTPPKAPPRRGTNERQRARGGGCINRRFGEIRDDYRPWTASTLRLSSEILLPADEVAG